jgi:hypothetical protein
MPGDARGLVDHKEGAISGLYEAFPVRVTPLSGGDALPAFAYRAATSRRLPAEEAPSPAFLETVVKGARAFRLTPAWIQSLESRLR